jgi:hypothetical protein
MSTHDFGPLIAQANARAQRRFSAMVKKQAYQNPYASETLLYRQAERQLRELEAERAFAATIAAFESRGLEMEELMEADLADNGLPDVPLAEWSENMLRAMWGDA